MYVLAASSSISPFSFTSSSRMLCTSRAMFLASLQYTDAQYQHDKDCIAVTSSQCKLKGCKTKFKPCSPSGMLVVTTDLPTNIQVSTFIVKELPYLVLGFFHFVSNIHLLRLNVQGQKTNWGEKEALLLPMTACQEASLMPPCGYSDQEAICTMKVYAVKVRCTSTH